MSNDQLIGPAKLYLIIDAINSQSCFNTSMNIFGKKFRVCITKQIMIRKKLLHSYLNAFQTVKNFKLLNYRKARLSMTSYRKSSITKLRITPANHIKKNSVANLIARQGITSNWSPLHN